MENVQTDPQHLRQLLEYAASEALARAQEFQIPQHIPPAFERPAQAVEGAFIGIIPFLKRVFIILATGTALLVSSIATYGLFYIAFMPGHHATEPLYFDYSGLAKHPSPLCIERPMENNNQILSNDLVAAAPWAVADLFSKHTQWEHFQNDVTPKPITETRILKESKAYYLEVVLDLPVTDRNRMTGMFGVLVELQSSNGTKLASSMRAARLPHESLWIATVRNTIWLIPLMVGAVQENRRVIVPSFRHFVESPKTPLRYVTVRLIMRESYLQRPEPLEVTKGDVRIGKELSDFQFLLREWFFTCYMVGTSIVFVLQLLGLMLVRLYWDYKRRRTEEDPSMDLHLDGSHLLDSSLLVSRLDDDGAGNGEWEDLPPPGEREDRPLHDDEGTRVPQPVPDDESSMAPPTPSLHTESTSGFNDSNPETFNSSPSLHPRPRGDDAPLYEQF